MSVTQCRWGKEVSRPTLGTESHQWQSSIVINHQKINHIMTMMISNNMINLWCEHDDLENDENVGSNFLSHPSVSKVLKQARAASSFLISWGKCEFFVENFENQIWNRNVAKNMILFTFDWKGKKDNQYRNLQKYSLFSYKSLKKLVSKGRYYGKTFLLTC